MNEIFPELKESEDERIRKEILGYIIKGSESFYDVQQYGKEKFEKWIAWLEKQREQNHADKIELKFKVGDWVVFNNKHQSIYQVEKVENEYYILRHTHGGTFRVCVLHDESLRLWTIADAKDGDVVVDKTDGVIGIFQSIGHHSDGGSCNDPSYCFLHCRYDDGYFYADFENGNTIDSDDVIPATKGQCDVLMRAMADAGYIFDFEKKELKKAEPARWGEEDDYNVQCLIAKATSDIQIGNIGRNQELIDWLKSLKGRVGCEANCTTMWKPSEEQIRRLEYFLKLWGKTEDIENTKVFETVKSLLNDLKQL